MLIKRMLIKRPCGNLLRIAIVALACCGLIRDDGVVVAEDSLPLASLAGKSFPASDSLRPGIDAAPDARECLAGLCWKPTEFKVHCQLPDEWGHGDLCVRFATPIPSGDARNDSVVMEWYASLDSAGRPSEAKAVVVVHESGRGMKVGRLIAQGLRLQGLHAFMIQLPFYGERRTDGQSPRDAKLIPMMRQAIADVRRARDAVAVLPWVDQDHIALQGTSLGGMVAATAAGLDDGYDTVFLMLAGGQLFDLIQNGKKDAARVREELEAAGLSGEALKAIAWAIEPTRLAHRMDPQSTWLYSGMFDTVVPPRNAIALARAAGLDDRHHIRLPVNHYTGIVYLPLVLTQIRDQVNR